MLCIQSVDPLATSDNENESEDDFNHQELNDTDFHRAGSDSPNEETKTVAQLDRSEEIIVVSRIHLWNTTIRELYSVKTLNICLYFTDIRCVYAGRRWWRQWRQCPTKSKSSNNFTNFFQSQCSLQAKTLADSIADPFVNVKSDENVQVDSNYNCPKCGKNLSSPRSLKRHIKAFHVHDEKNVNAERDVEEKSTITCTECYVVFTTDEYEKHKIVHKRSFECDVCQKVCKRCVGLGRHLYLCIYVYSKVFRTRFRLKVHYVMHVNEKTFLCETCSRPFARLVFTFRRRKNFGYERIDYFPGHRHCVDTDIHMWRKRKGNSFAILFHVESGFPLFIY